MPEEAIYQCLASYVTATEAAAFKGDLDAFFKDLGVGLLTIKSASSSNSPSLIFWIKISRGSRTRDGGWPPIPACPQAHPELNHAQTRIQKAQTCLI